MQAPRPLPVPMRVLGIDPGSTVTGFGVVELSRGRYAHIGSGCVKTSADEPMGERLVRIHAGLRDAIALYDPQEIAIEAIFRHKSSESALRLGQARGVAILAAAQAGFQAYEYNNSTVKATVGAHGKADKDAIAKLVTLLLGVRPDGPADVTDALAIAITHCAHARTRMLLQPAKRSA